MTIEGTLCFILRNNEVLLLKKSVGLFGQGKWNAPGGKILPGETAQQCAVREVLEETQLRIKDLQQIATVYFYKYDKRKDPDWKVHVFVSHDFDGTAADGREGNVKWFSVDALPLDEMWEDDRHWSRLVFEGKRFEGWFYYSGDFEKLADYRIEYLSTPKLPL